MNLNEEYLLAEATKFGMLFLILWILVILAVLIDLWDGLNTASRLHEKIKSHRMRITIDKISEYWRFLLIAALVDCVGMFFPFYKVPYASILFTIGLIAVECKSLFEHAKRRKSRAIELGKITQIIVEAVTEKDAKEAVKKVGEYLGLKMDEEKKEVDND